MKRLFTLIVLLGLLGVFAGCNSGSDTSGGGGTSTNPPPTTPSTNK